MLRASLYWRGFEEEWMHVWCVCMAESLHCSPETIITLLIGYTSIQNVFVVKKKKTMKLEDIVLMK